MKSLLLKVQGSGAMALFLTICVVFQHRCYAEEQQDHQESFSAITIDSNALVLRFTVPANHVLVLWRLPAEKDAFSSAPWIVLENNDGKQSVAGTLSAEIEGSDHDSENSSDPLEDGIKCSYRFVLEEWNEDLAFKGPTQFGHEWKMSAYDVGFMTGKQIWVSLNANPNLVQQITMHPVPLASLPIVIYGRETRNVLWIWVAPKENCEEFLKDGLQLQLQDVNWVTFYGDSLESN